MKNQHKNEIWYARDNSRRNFLSLIKTQVVLRHSKVLGRIE